MGPAPRQWSVANPLEAQSIVAEVQAHAPQRLFEVWASNCYVGQLMNILIPAPTLGPTLLTLLNQQSNLEHFAQQHQIDRNWLLTLHGDLRRGHQPTIMQGELRQLARALGKTEVGLVS